MEISALLTIIGMIGGFVLWVGTMLIAAGVIKSQFTTMKADVAWIKGKLQDVVLEALIRHDERIKNIEDHCEIK